MTLEHVCGQHLNKRMEQLLDIRKPKANCIKGVIINNNIRGGSVSCVVCGKTAPSWELSYSKAKER